MKNKFIIPLLSVSIITSGSSSTFDQLARLRYLLGQVRVLLMEQLKNIGETTSPTPAPLTPKPEAVSEAVTKVPLQLRPSLLITRIEPSHGPSGTEVAIHGHGFTSRGNDVHTNFGLFTNLPSPDGETIRLRVEPPGLPPNLGTLKTADFPELRFRFHVENENGATIIPGEFVLDL